MTDIVRGGQIPGNPVHIVFDPREPCRRMISRFVEGERLINVKFFEGVGTKPRDTYNSLKAEGRFAKPSTSTPMARPVYFPFVKERTLISPEPFLAAPHAQENRNEGAEIASDTRPIRATRAGPEVGSV
jgi:hypothetical protein